MDVEEELRQGERRQQDEWHDDLGEVVARTARELEGELERHPPGGVTQPGEDGELAADP